MTLDLSSLDSFDPVANSGLDLSSLDNLALPELDPKPSNKSSNPSQLDLSSLDTLFPKSRQELTKPPEQIRSKFGNRVDPFLGITKFHNGIDLQYALNTPVKSLGNGTVIDVGDTGKKDYGKYVTVDYGGGLEVTYGHLNQQKVGVGDKLSSDAIVGLSGNTGRSKGPHLHIKTMLNGQPVDPTKYFTDPNAVEQGLSTDKNAIAETPPLDLSSLDNVSEEQLNQINEDHLDYGSGASGNIVIDPNSLDFKIGTEQKFGLTKNFEALNTPRISGTNPLDIGDIISTEADFGDHYINLKNPKDINLVTDTWLAAWNSKYPELNQKFRAETGGMNLALVDSPKNLKIIEGAKYQIVSRPSRGVQALFDAYEKGGVPAVMATRNLIDQQIKNAGDEYEVAKNKIEQTRIAHPYLSAIDSAAQKEIVSWLNTGQNLKIFGKAIAIGNIKGYDSQEYLDAINLEEEQRQQIEGTERGIYQPTTTSGKIVEGVAGGIFAMPRFVGIGSVPGGSFALPAMVYFENLHKGNKEAARDALVMAVMVGASHGMGKALSGTRLINKNVEEVIAGEGPLRSINQTIAEETGGTSAAFRSPSTIKGKFTKEDLSIFTDKLVKGESTTIKNLTPFEHQLIMRGSNALTMVGTSYLTNPNQKLSDLITTLVVGLSFPVGKSPKQMKFVDYVPSVPTEIAPTSESVPARKTPLELGSAKVTIPLTASQIFENKLPIIENQRNVSPVIYPSSESPNVEKYGESFDPHKFVSETETGFQARGQGVRIELPLDTAALNLVDLKRSLVEQTWKTPGDNIATTLQKQQSIQNAINHLEKVLPEEVKAFFTEHENVIREALKTNQDSRKAKEAFLGKRKEALKPDDIKPVDEPVLTDGKLNPEIGKNNILGTEQKNAADIISGFSKLTTNKERQRGSFSNKPLGESKGIVQQTKDELSYLSAFFIEDLYHRGIEPTIDVVRNKLRGSLGDFSRELTDDVVRNAFNKGAAYFNSNQADPFFSRMKQDALEKLPNKLTTEQAKNVLSQHKNEFEWTVGLDEFLKNNEGKKFDKKELVDVIQKGQVRVEESVAEESYLHLEEDPIYKELLEEQSKILREMYDSEKNKTKTNLEFLTDEENWAGIKSKLEQRATEVEQLNRTNKPKYSLKAYSHEKLELPGAVNSKEVKLISPTTFDPDFTGNITINGEPIKYKSSHWDEPNVVAHYRSNDRTTTDNIPVYHSEEFQSDWNHDIRERGLPVSEGEYNNLLQKVVDVRSKIESLQEAKKSQIRDSKERLDTIEKLAELKVERQQLQNELDSANRNKVEPNPFMAHSWKELVIKRFVRDAVVAKDENGNYKYEGVSWTTAKQQAERYGNVLEGKSFKWQKNSDGTYSFDFLRSHNDDMPNQDVIGNPFWEQPHELRNISLERFAELTTKEAAEEVRSQENKLNTNEDALPSTVRLEYNRFGEIWEIKDDNRGNNILAQGKTKEKVIESYWRDEHNTNPSGKFSLKEAVELRGGMGTWADYDVALVNIAKKIGKRFGARYFQKEIPLNHKPLAEDFMSGEDIMSLMNIPKSEQSTYWINLEEHERDLLFEQARSGELTKPVKVHFLEITPSMRQSLEKEGFPLYGTGGSEPLKSQEVGVRNNLVTREAFDEHRNSLVQKLGESYDKLKQLRDTMSRADLSIQVNPNNKDAQQVLNDTKAEYEKALGEHNPYDSQGTVFNSGLNPDAFIDQTKLLYRGIKDFTEFSQDLIRRFGEQVKPFLQDLWIQTKNLGNNYSKGFDIAISDFKNAKDSPAFKARKFERGFLGKLESEIKDMKENRRKWLTIGYKLSRNVFLAQANSQYGEVYNVLRLAQRTRNSFETSVLDSLKFANDFAKKGGDELVAETLFAGNEQKKLFTDTELTTLGFNADQIKAYKSIRSALDLNLDWRKDTKLYSFRERANLLNDKLMAATPGTPEYINIQDKLLDLSDNINKVVAHFDQLKSSGYISLQRQGHIAAYGENPAFPVGDPQGKVYQHFSSDKAANTWVREQKANGIINLLAYDVKQPENLRKVAANLTPGQFEDLIDNAGVNPNDPAVEKLRDEVYARFPSFGYELKRDFTPGYDRNWKFVLNSIAHQTEVYSSSWYARIGGNEATKQLSSTGLYDSNYELYKVAQKYIDDEISSSPNTGGKQVGAFARKAVYMINLGGDINQLYLNAVAQPISQTYSYFARVEHNGIKLGLGETEKYFTKGAKLVTDTALNRADPDFIDIYNRLKNERVIEPEFNKSLLESEAEKSVQSRTQQLTNPKLNKLKLEHWAGVFMRAGEKTTRTHVAAEAYLVGKEKFGMAGEELVNFMVRAVDATQSNPTRGEAPYYVRTRGEVGKLFYQFNAFNHMWFENLILNARADFKSRGIKATARHIAPVVIMGGLKGLPLAGFAHILSVGLLGYNPDDDIDKLFKDNELLKNMALYGVTTSPAMSQKLTPSVPILDNLRVQNTFKDTVFDNLLTSTVPAISTSGQLLQAVDDLTSGQKLRGLAGLAPRALRGFITAERYKADPLIVKPLTGYEGEGILTRRGKTIVPRDEVTNTQLLGQTINITPTPVSKYYERQKNEQLLKLHKKLMKRIS